MKKIMLFAVLSCCNIICYTQAKVSALNAGSYVGETVTVCGKVYSGRFLESSSTQPTLLNMGGFFPNHTLTVMIASENRKKFPQSPEDFYVNKNICVTGKIINYKGKPEIIISNATEISVEKGDEDVAKQEVEIKKIKRQSETETPKKLIETERPKPLTDAERTRQRNELAKSYSSSETEKTKPAVETEMPKKQVEISKPKPAIIASEKKEVSIKPQVSSEPIATEKPGGIKKIKIKSEVNLRSGPGIKNSIITILKAGTVLQIHLTQGDWSYVSVDDPFSADANNIILQGFVKSNVLR